VSTPSSPETPPLALPELDKADDTGEIDVGVFDLDVSEGLVVDEDDASLDAFQIDIQEQDNPGSSEAATELDIGMSDLLDALPEPPPALEGDDLPDAAAEHRHGAAQRPPAGRPGHQPPRPRERLRYSARRAGADGAFLGPRRRGTPARTRGPRRRSSIRGRRSVRGPRGASSAQLERAQGYGTIPSEGLVVE